MWCLTCGKDVEVSEGDPCASRVQVKGGVLTVDLVVSDICSEDATTLLEARTTIERDLNGLKVLQAHKGDGHQWKVEVQKATRFPGLPGYVSLKLEFLLSCSCGELDQLTEILGKSVEMKPPTGT